MSETFREYIIKKEREAQTDLLERRRTLVLRTLKKNRGNTLKQIPPKFSYKTLFDTLELVRVSKNTHHHLDIKIYELDDIKFLHVRYFTTIITRTTTKVGYLMDDFFVIEHTKSGELILYYMDTLSKLENYVLDAKKFKAENIATTLRTAIMKTYTYLLQYDKIVKELIPTIIYLGRPSTAEG